MSLARIENRRVQVAEDPSKETHRALIEEEVSFMASQKARVDAAVANRDMAQQPVDALHAEIAELRADMEAARAKMPPPVPAVRTLDDLREYCSSYQALMKEFAERKQTLTHVLSYSPADFRHADLSVVSRWLDTWGPFFAEAEAGCKSLKRHERNTPSAAAFVPPTRDLYALLDEVCRLQLQARSLVGRERYRRSAYGTDSVEDFMDNQQQLLEWCCKQRATLAGLATLADLQEFGSSFHANVPVMDSNFLVLSEQCEVLAENPTVQAAMREVNAAWVDLCLGTYDKLRAAARAAHRGSGVEAVCAAWARDTIPRVELLARRVTALLRNKDEPAAAAPDAKRVRQRCDKALREQDAFKIVCVHLADFDVREDCVLPHYDALKHELTSAMTSTVLSFPSAVEYEDRVEYKNRIEELREWIDVKSQKGTYVKLLERLEDTKEMIEEYADALFPEEDASKAE